MNNEAGKIRVLTVNDYALLRCGISSLINAEPDMELTAQASTGPEAIDQFRLHRPDVTLMDLQMPDMSGVEAMIAIRSEFSNAQIILLSDYGGDVRVRLAFRAGARGCLLKSSALPDLVEAIRAVHAGKKRIQPEIASDLAAHIADGILTAREMDVLRLVAIGNANKCVAVQLALSVETVKRHITRILDKLGARDRTHAVTIGIRRGVIEL